MLREDQGFPPRKGLCPLYTHTTFQIVGIQEEPRMHPGHVMRTSQVTVQFM